MRWTAIDVLHTLPSLRGRRGLIVRGIYLALAALVFAVTAGSLASTAVENFRDQFSGMHYGILLGSDTQRAPMIGKIWPGVTAPGVTAGNRVVAVDGREIPAGESQFGVARMLRAAGPVLRLDLADDSGEVSHHRIARIDDISQPAFRRAGLRPMLFACLQVGNAILAAGIFFTISLLLFIRRPRDPEAMLLATGFLLLGLDVDWDSWLTSSTGIAPALLDRLENSLGEFGWWCILFGLCAFPDGRFVTRWSRFARLMPTAYVCMSLVTNFALWQSAFATLVIDIPIFGGVVIALLLRYRRLPGGVERQQIKLAALGAVVMVVVTVIGAIVSAPVVAAAIDPTATYLLDTVIGDLKQMAFPIGVLVSLLRYRLYDADKVITRSAGYAALTVTIVTVFACTEQVAQGVAQQYLGGSLGSVASGLGAAAAAIFIGPLHGRMTAWSERHFRSDLIALRLGLPPLVGDLREMAAPEAIAEAVLQRIALAVRAQHLALATGDGLLVVHDVAVERVESWLTDVAPPRTRHVFRKDSDPLFPLRVPLFAEGVGYVGWLLLGPRPDGSGYGKDEREALLEISDPVARALVVARDRQARDAAHADVEADYERRLARLEQHLLAL